MSKTDFCSFFTTDVLFWFISNYVFSFFFFLASLPFGTLKQHFYYFLLLLIMTSIGGGNVGGVCVCCTAIHRRSSKKIACFACCTSNDDATFAFPFLTHTHISHQQQQQAIKQFVCLMLLKHKRTNFASQQCDLLLLPLLLIVFLTSQKKEKRGLLK